MGCIVTYKQNQLETKITKHAQPTPPRIPDKEKVHLREVSDKQIVQGKSSSDTIPYPQLFH